MTAGSCSVAIRRSRPPQLGHARTSMANARCIKAAQLQARGLLFAWEEFPDACSQRALRPTMGYLSASRVRCRVELLGLRRLTLAGALAKLPLLASSTMNRLVLTGDVREGVNLLIGERART